MPVQSAMGTRVQLQWVQLRTAASSSSCRTNLNQHIRPLRPQPCEAASLHASESRQPAHRRSHVQVRRLEAATFSASTEVTSGATSFTFQLLTDRRHLSATLRRSIRNKCFSHRCRLVFLALALRFSSWVPYAKASLLKHLRRGLAET